MNREKLNIHAVILAGGRGTRFWPRSRVHAPKQLLSIVGKGTMLEQTIERLRSVISPDRIWTVTNVEQYAGLRKQLPAAARKRVLTEPIGRNTTAAIALAAVHVRHSAKGDALLAVLPADHYIEKLGAYRTIFRTAVEVAREPNRMVVLGIPPTRPDTGFGYIERTGAAESSAQSPVYAVRRFTEKPASDLAKEYLASGQYHWNAGMFFWRVTTFLDALREFQPKTHQAIEALAGHIGKRSYSAALEKIYPKLENISVDYAILEPATRQAQQIRISVIPAEIGWSDIGSWAAVYELLAKQQGQNIFIGQGEALDAEGNLFFSPNKFVAAIGVRDLILVDTPDALLICPRDRAQDAGRIVKALEARKLKRLL